MHIDSEYEKLIKEGYIEAGTLVVHVDDLTKLDLSLKEFKSNDNNKRQRHDKEVVVVDRYGRRKKVSSILLGYNKNQVELADGSFVNADELLEALQAAVSSLDKGAIVVDKKGRVMNPKDLLRVAEEAAGKIKIGGLSNKVTNQQARAWSIEGANSDVEHNKGLVFLGNDEIELREGEYISAAEFLKALQEYMVLTPQKKEPTPLIPIPPDPKRPPTIEREDKPFIVRVTRKYKNKLAAWLLLLALLLTALTGFRKHDKYGTKQVPYEQVIMLEQLVERDKLFYTVQGMEYEDVLETYRQSISRYASDLKIGDLVQVTEGDTFYENSYLTGGRGVIGQGLRNVGDYAVTGISVFCNDKYYGSYVDTAASSPGYDLGAFVNDIVTKYGLNYDDIQLRLHMGNDSDHTRVGWIDITELIKEGEINQEVIGKKAVEGSIYDGEVKDFKGTTITIETLDGIVEIPVVDASGNLYEGGTTVYGSDGKEYIISSLDIVEDDYTIVEPAIQTAYREEQVVVGKKLTWRVQDCDLTVAIAPLLGALASHIVTKKKNSDAQKNPSLFEFETEEEYQRFKKDFEEAKARYEKKSGFKKMLKEIFYRKEVDLLQRLTEEQIQQIYAEIRNWHDGDYSYNPNDKIEFRNGKIIVVLSDGRTQDITDIVMPTIAPIGKENEPVTEGLLEEEWEQKDGVRRR